MSIKHITSRHQQAVVEAAAAAALQRGREASASDPALPATLRSVLADEIERSARALDPEVKPSELLELQAKSARSLVQALDALTAVPPSGLDQAACQLATNLGAALAISEREDEIVARFASLGRQRYQIEASRFVADLAGLEGPAKELGGPLVHDAAFVRYVQGHGVTAPEFMLPGSIISALGDDRLRGEMQQKGERQVANAITVLADSLTGATWTTALGAGRGAKGGNFDEVTPSSRPSPETLKALAQAGYELAMVRDTLRGGGTPNWSRYPVAQAMLATGIEVSTLVAALHGLHTAAEQRTGKFMAELVAPPGVRAEDFSPGNLGRALRWAMKELASEKDRPGYDTRAFALAQTVVVPGWIKLEDEARYLKAEESFVFALQAHKREGGFYLEKGHTPATTLHALERLVERLETPASAA